MFDALVLITRDFETVSIWIAEVDRKRFPVVHGTQMTDLFYGFTVNGNVSYMFQKLKKPVAAHMESNLMMTSRRPTAPCFSFEQRQLGTSGCHWRS